MTTTDVLAGHWVCRYAPIAAVTIGALSLGAGAIYVAAAGGTAAAMASLSARIGASVAAATPTAKRLYKLAQRGQKVARVGQVVGIGGGAAATAASKSLEDHATSAGKSALKRLLQGSVLSSPGWLMDRDRTFRITGGPRASVVDGLLVIETDTTVPFELKDESGKTVAMGNQDGGDKVPKNEIVNDINDATEAIAKLSPSVKAAMVAATATGAAPALPTKKKDGLFMRMIKGDGMFL